MEAWKVRHSQLVLERKWLRVRQDHVILPNGHEIEEFHVIESPDWVGVLAFTEDGEVLLVDQYRHGIEGVSRELPAGVIDPGETPLESARRELLEETGYAAHTWQPLASLAMDPNRQPTLAHFFVARGARVVSEQRLDASEDMSVARVNAGDLLQQIDGGLIRHAVHIAAITLARARGLF
jgi:8-oxo-dGTP pyrophosphatase MutT (NUDIX family)